MLNLNIIPQEIKREIKIGLVYNITIKVVYIFIIMSSIIGTTLLTAEYILLDTLAKEINNSSLVFKNSSTNSQNQVNDINNKITLLESIQEDFIPWSKLFDYISTKTPEGITFSQISIKKENLIISFAGNALNRDILIGFRDILEESPIFDNIDFPIQSLLLKENINFEIKAIIKINEVIQ